MYIYTSNIIMMFMDRENKYNIQFSKPQLPEPNTQLIRV